MSKQMSDEQRARRNAYLRKWKDSKKPPELRGIDMRGRHHNGPKGETHHKFNAGRMLSSHGYVKVRVGKDHPLADPNGYAYEHALVVYQGTGHIVQKGENIHHLNGNKQDNRLENLQIVTVSNHLKFHNHQRSRNAHGQFSKGINHDL